MPSKVTVPSIWRVALIVVAWSVSLGILFGLLGDSVPGWLRGLLIGASTPLMAILLLHRRQRIVRARMDPAPRPPVRDA